MLTHIDPTSRKPKKKKNLHQDPPWEGSDDLDRDFPWYSKPSFRQAEIRERTYISPLYPFLFIQVWVFQIITTFYDLNLTETEVKFLYCHGTRNENFGRTVVVTVHVETFKYRLKNTKLFFLQTITKRRTCDQLRNGWSIFRRLDSRPTLRFERYWSIGVYRSKTIHGENIYESPTDVPQYSTWQGEQKRSVRVM